MGLPLADSTRLTAPGRAPMNRSKRTYLPRCVWGACPRLGAGRVVRRRHAGVVDARTVVVVAGLPGTGKSTMADRFVRVRGVRPSRGQVAGSAGSGGSCCWGGLPSSTAAGRRGRQRLRREVRERGGRLFMVECVCSAEAVHRRRIEGRRRARSSTIESKIARPSSWVHELVVAADAVPYPSELAAEGILGRRHRVLVLRTGDFERVVLRD